jgi:hypothetical protein
MRSASARSPKISASLLMKGRNASSRASLDAKCSARTLTACPPTKRGASERVRISGKSDGSRGSAMLAEMQDAGVRSPRNRRVLVVNLFWSCDPKFDSCGIPNTAIPFVRSNAFGRNDGREYWLRRKAVGTFHGGCYSFYRPNISVSQFRRRVQFPSNRLPESCQFSWVFLHLDDIACFCFRVPIR